MPSEVEKRDPRAAARIHAVIAARLRHRVVDMESVLRAHARANPMV